MRSRLSTYLAAAGTAVAILAAQAMPAAAQAYPAKPVRVIVPFAAGGGTDVYSRIWGEGMREATGQRFLIENMAGAAGAIRTKAGIAAAPDGYTIVMGVASTVAINPHILGAGIGYKPLTELKPIALLAYTPWIMVASAKLPFDSVKGLIDYDKQNPGKLGFGTWTSTGEIGRKVFALRTGVDLLSVPYDGAVAAMNDLVAGRASVAMLDFSSAVPFVEAKTIRAIAVAGPNRSDLVPGVPSIAEAGIKDMDINSWVAIFAPAGTPDDMITKLNQETNKVLAKPEVKAKLATLGADVFLWSPQETASFVATQSGIWERTIKETGSAKQ